MQAFIEWVTKINDAVNSAVWGLPGLILLIGTGILLTVGTKVFQVFHVGHWWKNTIGSLFTKNVTSKEIRQKVSRKMHLQTLFCKLIGKKDRIILAMAFISIPITQICIQVLIKIMNKYRYSDFTL